MVELAAALLPGARTSCLLQFGSASLAYLCARLIKPRLNYNYAKLSMIGDDVDARSVAFVSLQLARPTTIREPANNSTARWLPDERNDEEELDR